MSHVDTNRPGLVQSSGCCLCGVTAFALSMSVLVSFMFSSFLCLKSVLLVVVMGLGYNNLHSSGKDLQ